MPIAMLNSDITHADMMSDVLARRGDSKPTPTVTHFFQQGHTYSNKSIPPNSATPGAKHIQTRNIHYLQFTSKCINYKMCEYREGWANGVICEKAITLKLQC